MKVAILALADGTVFKGQTLGFEGATIGEVVFNTAMTGYQEILTDPSYKGQIVLMTSTQIGNYGVTPQDDESRGVWAEGFIVREASKRMSNWRGQQSFEEYLCEQKIVSIQGIDTRALTSHLREKGSQMGIISHVDLDESSLCAKAQAAPSIIGRDLVAEFEKVVNNTGSMDDESLGDVFAADEKRVKALLSKNSLLIMVTFRLLMKS